MSLVKLTLLSMSSLKTHLSHLLPSTKFTIFIHLSSKNEFKFPALASPNEVDP